MPRKYSLADLVPEDTPSIAREGASLALACACYPPRAR